MGRPAAVACGPGPIPGCPGILAQIPTGGIKEDPFPGLTRVFFNRRRDRVELLSWDRSGLCIWYKRIEKDRFRLASLDAYRNGHRAENEAAELALILEGIDLSRAKRRVRFVPRKTA